ncbi:MAG: O-antigen ligase family protein [Caloramator sp.]|nr:O-antigen ligase family protein [Caloramator sp.]
MGKNKKNMSKYIKENKMFIIPIALVVAIVPLIVKLKVIELDSYIANFWTSNVNYDFFSYNKSRVFLFFVLAAIMINFFNKGFKFKNNKLLYIFSFIYILSITISSLRSENGQIAFFGFPDRYEGLFVLIGYILIMLLTYNLINSYESLDIIIKSLYFSSVIIGIIGFFQYFNMDFFASPLGKDLIVPPQYAGMRQGLKFTLGERAVYGTLYHTNYMGSFTAILFMMTISLAMLNKNKVLKVVFSALSVLFFFDLIACHSRAGIVGIAFSLIILMVIFRGYIIKHYKIFAAIFIGSVVLIFAANKMWNNYLFNKIGTLFTDTQKLVSEKDKDNHLLKDLKCEGNRLKVAYNNITLYVELNDNGLKMFDEKNNILDWTIDGTNGKLDIEDNRYKDKMIYFGLYNNKPVVQFQIGTAKLNIVKVNDKYKILRKENEYYDITNIEKIGFEGKESLGSARGYIWSRTLPLIKKRPLFGYGPDNFAIYFPQNDVVGKINAYGDAYMLVDKAHNMYLQTLVNTGFISLISLIAILLLYIMQCFKIYIRAKLDTNYEIIGVSIFLGLISYLAAGLFNDSVISVAPIFWVLLGAGFAVNAKIEERKGMEV